MPIVVTPERTSTIARIADNDESAFEAWIQKRWSDEHTIDRELKKNLRQLCGLQQVGGDRTRRRVAADYLLLHLCASAHRRQHGVCM